MRKRAAQHLRDVFKRQRCANCDGRMRKDGVCESCGYEIVEDTKDEIMAQGHPPI